MDLENAIKQIAKTYADRKGNIQTEEATKMSLVAPLLTALGYDVFDPSEVVPEYVADVGTKKGEKIDYAIMKDGKPIMLMECKHWKQDLNLHDNQLVRYFHVGEAKFGVLTNGIIYRFYTDLVAKNKMDEKPFLEVNMLDLREHQIEELKKFHKSYFDVDTILSSASELKYTSELKQLFVNEFSNPSPDFVKHFARQVYDGTIWSNVLEKFTELVKKSLQGYINDKITERLKSAIEKQEKPEEPKIETSSPTTASQQLPEGVIYMSEDGKIVTTQEEIEAFYIVVSIVRQHINSDRVTYRDAQSYFAVFIDDNNRKPICRFYLDTPTNKRIAFFDENKKEMQNKISVLDDIYNYSEQLIGAVKKYL